jgi:hypothetical protein
LLVISSWYGRAITTNNKSALNFYEEIGGMEKYSHNSLAGQWTQLMRRPPYAYARKVASSIKKSTIFASEKSVQPSVQGGQNLKCK